MSAVVDAVRIKGQVEAVRASYGRRVVHIHLTAPKAVLAKRFKDRRDKTGFQESKSYKRVLEDPTEARVDDLMAIANVNANCL